MRTSAMSALWEVALQVGQGNCGIFDFGLFLQFVAFLVWNASLTVRYISLLSNS